MNGTECRLFLGRCRALVTAAALPAPATWTDIGLGTDCLCSITGALSRVPRVRAHRRLSKIHAYSIAPVRCAATHTAVSGTENSVISAKLSESQILRDYEAAFSETTGLPLKFAPVGKKRAGMRGSSAANQFCTHMAEIEPGCRLRVEMQENLATAGADGKSHSATCLAGLTDSAVPVRIGSKVLGYLQTGQVALKKLTPANFRRVTEFLKTGGADVDWDTTGMTFTQYLSMLRITKAQKLLPNPQARISEVAFESGFASITHFNRMFRRVTGQSPTDFRHGIART